MAPDARGHRALADATIIGLVSVATAIAGALIADVAPERALRLGFAVLLVHRRPARLARAEAQSSERF